MERYNKSSDKTDKIADIMEKIKLNVKNFDFKKFINRILPITLWLPMYNLEKFRGDVIAGMTVGIMIIPQAIAFSTLAGLPPQYGLYAALTPGIVYCLLGTSKDVSMGPTVTMALFTYRFNATLNPIGASSLAFLVGLILIAMSILRLGFVTKFMPSHVISGFVSAAAIVIATTQLKTLFGYKSNSSNFVNKIIDFFKLVKNTNPWDVSLGVFCLLFLAFFMIMSRTVLKRPANDKPNKVKKICLKILNFICVARSALVCIIGTVVTFAFHKYGHKDSFSLAGKLPTGLPKVQVPLQSVTLELTNQTLTAGDFIDGFGAALIVLPLIQFIQCISIATAFGKMYKYEIDSTQELLALGVANVIGSFFGGFPITGSFSRSAVNSMSGTRTPFSGVISCLIVFLAVSFLTPVFYYIPKTALSAMIIMAVVTMVDTQVPRQIWKIKKIDLLPFLITFFGTFYKLEMGVLAGAGVAVLIMISREINPQHDINIKDGTSVMITFKGSLSYPAIETFKAQLLKMLKKNLNLSEISVDMHSIQHVDYGVVIGFKNIIADMDSEGVTLSISNFANETIKRSFMKAGCLMNPKVKIPLLRVDSSSSSIPMDNLKEEDLCLISKDEVHLNIDVHGKPHQNSNDHVVRLDNEKENDSLINSGC